MVEIYKVGGAVRDQLLGITPVDTDYVVVGASKEYMQNLGFIEVGRDFPVYLHPKTHEEYALARLERKSGLGHSGFSFDTNESVSLIDDLKRRDITINAMAEDIKGNLIDPFNGKKDLENKIIRHVSRSFTEDPLRVLRVARFSAKFNFTIAPETLALIKEIVASTEILLISQERINNEIAKALFTLHAENFFAILAETKALEQILPKLANAIKDTNLEIEFNLMLTKLNEYSLNLDERFALLGFYMANTHFFTKKAKRLSNILLTSIQNITQLNILTSDDIQNIINRIDPIRRIDDYSSFKKLLILIANLRKDSQLLNNIDILDKIIVEFQNINYHALKNQADFINQIKVSKLKIIEEIFKKVT